MEYTSVLPPFSPDYAGAGSVFFDYRGTILINGASGCLANYAGYDEPRYFTKRSTLLSSGLRDIRAVFGDEDFLREALPGVESLKSSRYLLLLSSPAASVIGTDHDAVATAVERVTGVPTFSLETTGMRAYDKGIQEAFGILADRYLFMDSPLGQAGPLASAPEVPPAEKVAAHARRLGVIGLSPLDYWGQDVIDAALAALAGESRDVTCTLGVGGELEDVARLREVDLICVVSVTGLPLARKIRRTFGVPFVVGIPVGPHFSRDFDAFVAAHEHDRAPGPAPEAKKVPATGARRPAKVLVVGQQVWARSYRLALEERYPGIEVTVGTLFAFDRKIARTKDVKIETEGQLEELMCAGFDFVVGDPLLDRVPHGELEFVGVPHMAVSSRLFQYHEDEYVGERGLDRFEERYAKWEETHA